MTRAHPDYSFYSRMRFEESRRSTFSDFPQSAPVRPNQLAAAGFFFTGTKDDCTCAFCRCTIGKWEVNDDVMNEHRRHSPLCLLVRGDDVGNVPATGSSTTRGADVADAAMTTNSRNTNTVHNRQQSSQLYGITLRTAVLSLSQRNDGGPSSRELKARMDRPMAKRMVDVMGFDAQHVKKAIYDRLVSAGEDFERAEDLVEAVYRIQNQENGMSQNCESCHLKPADRKLLPCHHGNLCDECANIPEFCPECGVRVKGASIR